MALKVWFPLHSNLYNLGLENVNVTSFGDYTTVINGKTGPAAFFNGSTRLELAGFNASDAPELSVCCWVMPNNANLKYLFGFNRSGQYWQFCVSSTTIEIRDTSTGPSGTRKSYSIGPITANKWLHFCVTYNRGEVKVYKDGVLYNTYNTGGQALNPNISLYYIGAAQNSSYYFNGYINDFRIYDNCLSEKEVKQISQGLVVHYRLDDPYIENTVNLFSGKTDMSITSIWYKGRVGASQQPTINNDGDLVLYGYSTGTSNNQSYVMTQAAGYIPLSPSTTYTLSMKVKQSVTNIRFRPIIYELNSTSTNEIKSTGENFFATSDEVGKWVTRSITITTTSATTRMKLELNCMYSPSNTTITIKKDSIQLEAKDHATPFTFDTRNLTTVYDSSGYGRNGTRKQMDLSDDTTRYNHSVVSTQNPTQGLFRGNVDIPASTAITFCWWGKYSALGFQGSGFFTATDQTTPTLYTGVTCNMYDGKFSIANTNNAQTAITASGFLTGYTSWHHYALTYDGENLKYYRDAELKNTKPFSGALKSFKYLFPSWSNAGDSNRVCQGNVSDFRIYVTALQESDILSLYNRAASIDNEHCVHAYEYEELFNTNVKVKKSGIANSKSIVELSGSNTTTKFTNEGIIKAKQFNEI